MPLYRRRVEKPPVPVWQEHPVRGMSAGDVFQRNAFAQAVALLHQLLQATACTAEAMEDWVAKINCGSERIRELRSSLLGEKDY